MPSMWLTDQQKLGVAFCTGGFLSFFTGLILFFDRALLAFGNILFIIGLTLTIGLPSTLSFFFSRPAKYKGTAAFFAGITLILMRWTFFGFFIELYGLFVLFGEFLGVVAGFVRGIPVVGPKIAGVLNVVAGSARKAQGQGSSELPV